MKSFNFFKTPTTLNLMDHHSLLIITDEGEIYSFENKDHLTYFLACCKKENLLPQKMIVFERKEIINIIGEMFKPNELN